MALASPAGSLDAVRKSLPIYEYRDALVDAIREYDHLVVVGDTGSGKTTQIPQYILEDIPDLTKIAITQPRRIAAISAARRVSQEQGAPMPSLVGYKIRFDRSITSSTRAIYMTDGVLLREAIVDPILSEYDAVLLDEAHERSLETDVVLGLLKRAAHKRPLKIIIMSATLDVQKFSDFFDQSPVFSVPGRMYEVDIYWQKKMKLGALKSSYLSRSVQTVMHIHKTEEPGDILVFLTGQQEIEIACARIKQLHAELDYRVDVAHHDTVRGLHAHAIYGTLETREQRSIFDPAPKGVRKVVFATNIAQTSVTIPGIRYVVDTGFVKQKMYDPQTSMDALLVVPISQATATQRAGRAGRTASGKVYRLYSRDAFDNMDPETLPEIQRSSLISTVLSLKKFGISDILTFEFIDPPDPALVTAACRQLYLLGALNEAEELTPLGDLMARFPISPFLSRALIASAMGTTLPTVQPCRQDDLDKPTSGEDSEDEEDEGDALRKHRAFAHTSGDHWTLYNVYESWRNAANEDRDESGEGAGSSFARRNYLHIRALQAAKNVREQLEEIMVDLKLPNTEGNRKRRRYDERERVRSNDAKFSPAGDLDRTPVIKALCSAFFLHLAQRHASRPYFFHYLSARGGQTTTDAGGVAGSGMMALSIHPSSAATFSFSDLMHLDFVVYHDLQFSARAFMRTVSRVDFRWIEPLLERVFGREKGNVGGIDEKALLEGGDVSIEEDMVEGSNNNSAEFEPVQHEFLDAVAGVEGDDGKAVGNIAKTKELGDRAVAPKVREVSAEDLEAIAKRKEKEGLARARYLGRRKRK
ncbi:P-loop containing nucleoside triphosphate hydrolase protein [Cladochytrium replicatum]|nr:P-loop containing nucleoside triphosphate hydrolase protein [Cladochytrium replicatum]